MRKYLYLGLLSLAVILLVSCADTSTEEYIPEWNEDVEQVYDFYGYEFKIYGQPQGNGVFSLNPTYGETTRGDKILKRYGEVEKALNIDIVANGIWDNGEILTQYAAGGCYCDLYFVSLQDSFASCNVQKGLFNDFSQLGLDMHSGKYGTEEMIKAVTFNDGIYGFIPNYWGVPVFHSPYAVWFNNTLLASYGQTSPHELDENGEWNWKNFEGIIRSVFDNSDSDPNNWIYGLCYAPKSYLAFSAIFSNGGRLADVDSSGRLVYKMNSPNTTEALEWIASMVAEGILRNDKDNSCQQFVDQKEAFYIEYPWLGLSTEGGSFALDMEVPYEWITFPTGPSGDPTVCPNTISFQSRFIVSPIGADLDVLAVAVDMLFEPLDGEEETLWYDEFNRSNFYSEKSFDYFVKMRNEAVWDYSTYLSNDNVTNMLYSIISGQKSATSELESVAESMQETIDQKYNNYINK